ncbi:Hypothetical protein D9617_3g022850 [Elsinoe fawcettii]|nr:Hypothetical protein D9617_3g022850 [Elsinoe fawcettii]
MQTLKQCRASVRWSTGLNAPRTLRRCLNTPRPADAASRPNTSKRVSALARLQASLPPRLRPYLSPLLSAPVSHITSFLILHEITALIPLGGLFGLFHYSNAVWLERWRKKVEESENFQEGVRKWGRYARRKGWISDDDEGTTEGIALAESTTDVIGGGGHVEDDKRTRSIDARIEELEDKSSLHAAEAGLEVGHGQSRTIVADTRAGRGARLVVELATAYAITKVLLPFRIAASVWATPWFARIAVQPISNLARRLAKR